MFYLALGVKKKASLIGPWMMCTENISYYHNAGSMIAFHKNLTTRGYRALIYRLETAYLDSFL